MYKIYVNQNCIFLREYEEDLGEDWKGIDLPYGGKPNELLKYVDLCEKSHKSTQVSIWSKDLGGLWEDFVSLFREVPAAGGLVLSPRGVAMIFRLDHWDLPKGKIEKGESNREAALREVEEEVDLHGLEIRGELPATYHIYRDRKERRVLKRTSWYLMRCEAQDMLPQKEEGIEKADWYSLEEAINQRPTYLNILDVLNFYKKNQKNLV